MFKKITMLAFLPVFVLIVYLVISESPIDPVAYHPPGAPDMTGALAPNNLLQNAVLLGRGNLNGPEDVAFDKLGRVYSGLKDGRIVRITAGGAIETFAETGGRPRGMKFDARGNFIVCDAYKGLVSVDENGKITVLATTDGKVPFKCTDALDISHNGIVYFTDASDRFFLRDHMLDMMEVRPHGRFMSYDPTTKKVTVLLDGFCFANGVALSKNEDYVLINETYKYRIVRYWLKGVKAGASDIFIDNLPGFPDNISSDKMGTFWLAFFSTRNPLLDMIHGFPLIKSTVVKLPKPLWARPASYGLVVSLNEQGEITRSLHDPEGLCLKEITSAREYGGYLYLGSLHADRIGRYKL